MGRRSELKLGRDLEVAGGRDASGERAADPFRSALRGWEARGWYKQYFAGLALLDLDDPSQVRGLMRTPLLAPAAPYEIEGFRGSVIFPCGLIYNEGSGEVRLYYGAADTSVALATGHIDDLIAACEPL